MSQLTAEQITKLFIYGDNPIPNDLASDALIRPPAAPGKVESVTVDINEYMTSGPGRFASSASFEVISRFMTGSVAPGTYDKTAILKMFGYVDQNG